MGRSLVSSSDTRTRLGSGRRAIGSRKWRLEIGDWWGWIGGVVMVGWDGWVGGDGMGWLGVGGSGWE